MNSLIAQTRPRRIATALLVAALASTTLTALTPSAALAVPAGGYADLVERAAPSVVLIEVTTDPMQVAANTGEQRATPFEDFQRRFGVPDGQDKGVRQGVGSGFIISEDGMVVTNNHVVEGAQQVTVKLSDGRSFDAKIIGADPLTDVALLKIEADTQLPFVTFGESAKMRPGDEVLAVGNPFGLGGSVTSGIISATSRDIHSGPYDDFIQTDAAINRGNSGGPLFNNAGEVIGVNTAIFSPDGGSIGIGFAVPSDLVQKIAADLEDDGHIDRGWLGVQIKPMSDEVADALGYDGPRGAVVEGVGGDSPAARAGLKKGDIILSYNGSKIEELRDLPRMVAETTPDTPVKIVVLRKGTEMSIDLTVGNLSLQDA